MGAENAVTAADLVYWASELADLLREHLSLGHCQYPPWRETRSRQAGPPQRVGHRPARAVRLAPAAAAQAVLAPGVPALVSAAPVPCTARPLPHRAA